MKKYLMTGMAAIAFCAAFTSCSKGEDIYDPDFKQKEVTLSYEQAFINTFGQPAADQDWGFGTTTRGITRGECGQCYKYDMQYDTPSFPKTGHPADITDKERTYVKWWFENNPGLSEVGMDIHNFYLQHVWGQPNKPYTVVYERGNYSENGTMDYLEVGDGTNYTHVLDFNANGPGSYGIVYMRNSSALGFGFHATWGDRRDYHNFKLAHIVGDYEGEHIDGWYVGLAMYAEKDDNGLRVMNGDKWNYADDWILKIVPGEGEVIPSTIRVIGEDLSANTPSDFDFNDIVVDVTLTSTGADCVLQAAGGTLPLIIGIDEPDDTKDAADYPNNEVHKLFGVSVDTMVNTNAENTPDPKDPTKMLKGVSNVPAVSFSITGSWSTVKDVPIYVKKNGHWMELTAERGVPASKIGVETRFNWCLEKKSIKTEYPRFTDWVTRNLNNQSKWY